LDWNQLKDQVLVVWKLFQKPLFELSGTRVSIANFIIAVVVFIVGVKLAKFAENLVSRGLRRRHVDIGVRGSIERFTRYVVVVVALFLALDTVGFKMSSLAAFGAVLMVGVGFGLQNITSNFISGIIILIERPVKSGDIVKVGDTTGRIVDVNVRSTLIQTRDDVAIIVPNSDFISQQVINHSFQSDTIRGHIRIGVAYGSDLEKVRETLLSVALAHKEVLNHPPAVVVFENFGDSSLDFDLRFWTRELWEIDRVCSELRFMIDAAFRAQKIQIPFPQRDLHVVTPLQVRSDLHHPSV
jgi:small-conductance mechanosensitive channel